TSRSTGGASSRWGSRPDRGSDGSSIGSSIGCSRTLRATRATRSEPARSSSPPRKAKEAPPVADLDLFGKPAGAGGGGSGERAGEAPADAAAERGAPLAARMRPRTLAEFRGQEHLLGPGK